MAKSDFWLSIYSVLRVLIANYDTQLDMAVASKSATDGHRCHPPFVQILLATVNTLFLKVRNVIRLLSLPLSLASSSLSSRSWTLSFSILSVRLVLTLTNLFSLSSAVSDAILSAVFRLRIFSLSSRSSGVSDSFLSAVFSRTTSSLWARFLVFPTRLLRLYFFVEPTIFEPAHFGVSKSIICTLLPVARALFFNFLLLIFEAFRPFPPRFQLAFDSATPHFCFHLDFVRPSVNILSKQTFSKKYNLFFKKETVNDCFCVCRRQSTERAPCPRYILKYQRLT